MEILKALMNGADLLILDEPTSVLTSQESRDLFQNFREMRDQGHMIILISHKLDEILELCDRVTVLQKGKVVGEADTKMVDKKGLARMMIGRDIIFQIDKEPMERSEKVIEIEDATVKSDKGLDVVKNVSFEVYRNEIFGIAGVSGNGGAGGLALVAIRTRPAIARPVDTLGNPPAVDYMHRHIDGAGNRCAIDSSVVLPERS